MRHALYLLLLVLTLTSCKHTPDETLAPVVPLNFTIPADSIRLNPYGYTPLAALVSFSTSRPGKTFIRVRGKHGKLTTIEHTFTDVGTYHAVPIIGLYPNYTNLVDIRIINTSGDTLAKSTITIQTGDLPPNFPISITAAPFDETKLAPGLLLVSNFSTSGKDAPLIPYFLDAYGDIRWVLDYSNHPQLKTLNFDNGIDRLRNGNFFFGDVLTSAIYEVNLLGQLVNKWKLDGHIFHHNVIEKPTGNFIITTSKPGSTNLNGITTIEDYVIEISRQDGKIINEWDLKQSLDEQRTAWFQGPLTSAGDWFHGNSVAYDSTDNTIVVSGRHQGVVKLDYQNKVKWILAPHRGWTANRRNEDLHAFLLKPLDANGKVITDTAVINGSKITADFEWNCYQHSNIFLPTGELMVFDNGDIREYNNSASKYSRAVTYKINPVTMTVQQTWAYGKERGLATYSRIVSSIQLLPQSNHVIFAPGFQVQNATGQGGKILEIDYITKQVLSEISISSANKWGFHRAKKMSAYP